MDKLKIKITVGLDFIRQIVQDKLSKSVELVDKQYSLLISEEIPDEQGLFIVVWDKHDVKKIDEKILEIKGDNKRHKFLRGIFLKEDVQRSPDLLIKTIKEIIDEIQFKNSLKENGERIKGSKNYIDKGSLINIRDKATADELENIFSRPRFTSLFIDKPMLQLMHHLSRILEEMKPAIDKLEKDYGSVIDDVNKNKGLDAKKGFDQSFVSKLHTKRNSHPVRLEPILLTGETGVGKTLIARWIHGGDNPGKKRFPGSFQEINASGLSPNLLESDIFGHVKGAFTGAIQDKPGKALLALGGVLFLDEIGDIPLEIQPRIMKFIEEKTFVPEGWYGENPFYVPSLIVAATNKNLEKEVEEGRLRKDFYARFHHRVHIPSVRERIDSIHVLVDFILQNPMVNGNGKIKYISNSAIEKLRGFKHDENFRGLERIVRDAAYRTLECGLDIILPEVIADESYLYNFGLSTPEPLQFPKRSYETEYKFLITGDENYANEIFRLIRDIITNSALNITYEGKVKSQVDTYFDDDRHTLHEGGSSFRVREGQDNVSVTLKKRLPVTKFSNEGLYERMEEEAVITDVQKIDLIDGRPINVLPYRLIRYIAPSCEELKPILKVINKRKTSVIEDTNHSKAEVCFDNILYEIGGKIFGPYFEVEIESKGLPFDIIKTLAERIVENLGLIPSQQSKYERGISLIRTNKIRQEKRLVIIDTDCGVDDALALILAMRSPELDVKAVTTVSGNVHIDNVVPNVFKVFNALNIDEPPIVAKGAEQPLKRVPVTADSVHGKDGLGDIVPAPDNIRIDSRPAWKVICDLAKEYPKRITLITLGPMTNLALAIKNDAVAVSCLKDVVAMGGVFFDIGNIGPDAEFNVAADPDAAYEVVKFCRDSCLKLPVDAYDKRVFLPANPTMADYGKIADYQDHDPKDTKMLPLTFVGLDVTHKTILRRAVLNRLVAGNPEKSLLTFVRDITKKYMDFYYGNEGLPGCYLHDPLAIAYVINPSLLKVEQHIVRVETKGEFTNGVIFPDDRPTRNPAWRNPAEEVIGIARKVEREAFEEFFLRRIMEGV